MEIRQQHIDRAETVARGDEKRGLGGERPDLSELVGGAFE